MNSTQELSASKRYELAAVRAALLKHMAERSSALSSGVQKLLSGKRRSTTASELLPWILHDDRSGPDSLNSKPLLLSGGWAG